MKRHLFFYTFIPVDMPDITTTSPAYQKIIQEKVKAVLDKVDDEWFMEFQGEYEDL